MWSPPPELLLHAAPENSAFYALVVYTPDDPFGPTAVSYSAVWLSPNVPYNVVFSASASSLAISGPNVLGMAPIVVNYLRARLPGTVTRWSELPEDAEQVIQYIPPPAVSVSASFRVDALLTNGATVSQTYSVQASVNFDTGRDLLVSAVNFRR